MSQTSNCPSRPAMPPESEWVFTLPDGDQFTLFGRDAEAIGLQVEREIKVHLRSKSLPRMRPRMMPKSIARRLRSSANTLGRPLPTSRPSMAPPEERIASLAQSFPTLRNAPLTPWDPTAFAQWLDTSPAVTSGSRHAGEFILSVWGGGTYQERHFNVVRAMGVWDGDHRAAFRAWTMMPWWC